MKVLALLFAYGQSSHGVASSIRDTPWDDLSIQKSNANGDGELCFRKLTSARRRRHGVRNMMRSLMMLIEHYGCLPNPRAFICKSLLIMRANFNFSFNLALKHKKSAQTLVQIQI